MTAEHAAKSLPSIGALLDATFAQTKRHFWPLVWLMVLPGVVTAFAQLFLDPRSIAYAEGTVAVNLMVVVPLLVVGALWSILAYAATLQVLSGAKGKLSVAEAYRASLKYVLPILGVSILTALAVLGGLILLIIPGLVFALWYSFAGYVVVNEQVGVIDAMRRSRHYVTGRFWGVVGRIFLLGLATFAVSFIYSLLLAGVSIGVGTSAALWIGLLLSIIVLTPVQIVATVYYYQLYEDLRSSR